MLFIRLIIESIKFLRKLLHSDYTLVTVRYNEIIKFDNPTPNYQWNKLEKSITTLGYIPSIVVYSYFNPDTNIYEYYLVDGRHRLSIIGKNKTPNDRIKVWVSKKHTLNNKLVRESVDKAKKVIQEQNKKLMDDLKKRNLKSPNIKRLHK
jgi:hypothetical protein